LGFLKDDWLANMLDPLPVFSFLVYLVYSYLPEYTFYLLNILMFGIYLYSITGIASSIYHIDRDRSQHLLFLAAIIALHSYALDSYSMRTVGIEVGRLVHYGVADQHLIGRIFQPSVFGVFILLSIYAFLCHQILLAAVLVAVPSLFHPAYLLTSAMLTLSYMAIDFRRRKRFAMPFAIGILNFVLVLPIVSYFYIQFSPSSPEVWNKASEILVNVRSPHHMKTDVWLDGLAYAKCTMMIVALYLIRKTQLFAIMCLPLVTAVLLTIVQKLTGSNALAASTPWRISVFLVPLSISMILAWAVSCVFGKYAEAMHRDRRLVTAVSSSVIVILVLYGVNTQVKRHSRYHAGESIGVMNFVRETKSRGELYLVPVDLEDFRLYTGAPTFVTFKSGPVKDVEYLEWYKRLTTATKFYESEKGTACKILGRLVIEYGITHVVAKTGQGSKDCRSLYQLYTDERFRVYRINKNEPLVTETRVQK
jgi:hypothetical protein